MPVVGVPVNTCGGRVTEVTRADGGSQHPDKRKAGGHGPTLADQLEKGMTLLPTPVVNDMGAGKTVDYWDAWTERMQAGHSNGNGHGKSLAIEAMKMLPTATARDGKGQNQRGDATCLPGAVALLPTPGAQDGNGRRSCTAGRSEGGSPNVRLGLTLTDWAQILSGVSTDQRLNGGKPAPDQHPHPSMTKDGSRPDSLSG
jgi:hypothetical protein